MGIVDRITAGARRINQAAAKASGFDASDAV